MKKFWYLVFAVVLASIGGLMVVACDSGGDDDDDSDDDVADECDLEVLTAQTEDLCGGEVTYTGQADSDDACGATCSGGEVGYWYDSYGACTNECFCCGPAAN